MGRMEWRDEEEKVEPDPLRPSAIGVLRQTFTLCYDYLGLTLAGSLAAFLIGLLLWPLIPPALFGASLVMQFVRWGVFIALSYPLMAGPYALARRMALREDPGPKDLLQGWRRHALPALVLGLFNGLIGAALAGDVFFFLTHPQPLLRLLSVPFGYFLVYWAVSQPYGMPLLLHGFRPLRALRQQYLLVLANPLFTGAVSFVIIILTALSAATWVPMMLVTPMVVAVAGVCATHALLLKYDALDRATRPASE